MEILTFEQLPQGGFAGLIEKQFVKDSKVFSPIRKGIAADGIGNFVYLADANFLPHGETRMHPHHEIDVISVMVEGEITHQGSLEHGQSLVVGQAQVQRAGGEGFSHNEINPNGSYNQLIQLWVLPENAGEPSGYKVYQPKKNELTTIYGGDKSQSETFDSHTYLKLANVDADTELSQSGQALAYLSKGDAIISGQTIKARSLIKVDDGFTYKALSAGQLIVITTNH